MEMGIIEKKASDLARLIMFSIETRTAFKKHEANALKEALKKYYQDLENIDLKKAKFFKHIYNNVCIGTHRVSKNCYFYNKRRPNMKRDVSKIRMILSVTSDRSLSFQNNERVLYRDLSFKDDLKLNKKECNYILTFILLIALVAVFFITLKSLGIL